MRIKKLAALALSAVTAAVVSLSVPATAATSAGLPAVAAATQVTLAEMPPLEAVFNNPLPKGTAGFDRTIENRLLHLIGKATPTSSIRVSLYEMEDAEIVDALIAARTRGTDVRVLSERCPWGEENRCGTSLPQAGRLAQALGKLPDGTPRVVLCEMGCMQTKDINHDKFWLFSQLSDGVTEVANVAVQSSHNLGATTAGLADNMVVSARDAQIYQGYEHTWNTMRAKELAGETAGLWPEVDVAGTGDFSGHAGTVAGWRYPRVAKSGTVVNDPVARSIAALDCATGPEVHIAMASWGGRTEVDKALLGKVDEVGANGKRCAFRILTAGTPKLAADLEPNAAHPDRDVQLWTVTQNQLNGASGGLHSKYVLLSWDDAAGAHRVVHTGSDNFSNPAVTAADESSLRLTDARIYSDFRANWDLLRAQNDLTANNLTDIPFLYEYSSKGTAQPFTFGTTEFGTFRNPKHPPVESTATALGRKSVKGDFNGDGVLDIVTLNDEGTSASTGKKTFSFETFRGKPDGRYATGVKSWTANSDWGWYSSMRLTSGDYNGDGRDDVAALYTRAGAGDVWSFYTFLAQPDGTFTGPKRAFDSVAGWGKTSQMKIVSGKFDSDQRDDIAALYTYADGGLGLHTFTAKDDGTFNASFRSWYVTNNDGQFWGSGDRTTIVSGDFDGNGRDDIGALYDYESGAVGLHTFTSKVDGSFNAPVGSWKEEGWGSATSMKLTTGDFNGDGRDDIASLYKYSVTAPNPVPMAVHIFGTKADGTFTAPFRGWYGTSFPPDSIQLP
ncbi:phospholipase D-like domain-containing protein [Streptomyces sp. NPDC056374]|uniref:phospholipase D-like domain-containing protein n=1 Tax=unclassified Streptomyces TaxID=2593676 RepID=UPI0035D896AF